MRLTFEQGAFLAAMIAVTGGWLVWIVGHALVNLLASQ